MNLTTYIEIDGQKIIFHNVKIIFTLSIVNEESFNYKFMFLLYTILKDLTSC